MINCLLTCCDYIGIIVTLMGVCAVFVTVSPILYDRKYKELSKRLEDIQKELYDLKNKTAPMVKRTKAEQDFLEQCSKNGTLQKFLDENK